MDKIVDDVVTKLKHRSFTGYKKYGKTLNENNSDNYLIHLQEELMDASLYIQKLLSIKTEIHDMIDQFPNDSELGYAIRLIYGTKY